MRKEVIGDASPKDLKEFAIHLQEDARYLYEQASIYRDKGDAVNAWVSTLVQEAAATSASHARRYTEILG